MPGSASYPPRRSQIHGISKHTKQAGGSTKRPIDALKQAIFNAAQTQSQDASNCLVISRQCSPAPAVRSVPQWSISHACPPPQVVLFFDHINGRSPSQRSHDEAARFCRSLRDDMSVARTRLQSLLLHKDDVIRLAGYAQSWMALYHGLYTLTYTFRTGSQLVATHDRMQSSEVHPVLLSMHLLCLAMSWEQAPAGLSIGNLSRSDYISQVCDVVEEVVVRKSMLAGTVEGLETCMLLLMLAVGRNDLTTICLTLNRLTALADLMGLARAGNEHATQQQPSKPDPYMQAKIQVWEAICAIDRNFSMMLKLPASTTSSFFPLHQLVWREGRDIAQSYNYYLARISGMVTSVEKSYSNGDGENESYRWVTAADNALTNLASMVPKAWSESSTGKPTEMIVKFWHQYIKLRAHLRPALLRDPNYEKDRVAVKNACLEALRLFCSFRSALPSGFFYCRVLDIQGFTAAVLLLLLSDRTNAFQTQEEESITSRAVACFKAVLHTHTASSFARKAGPGISRLQMYLQEDTKNGSASTTVHIPLLGNVRIEKLSEYQPTHHAQLSTPPLEDVQLGSDSMLDLDISTTSVPISFTIDFENDSPWTPPASRAGGYARD